MCIETYALTYEGGVVITSAALLVWCRRDTIQLRGAGATDVAFGICRAYDQSTKFVDQEAVL